MALAIKIIQKDSRNFQMRVSKEQAETNRISLLQAAGRLFNEKGFDGVGVAEVAKEAGLTHGALYAHFPSKDALATEAFSDGIAHRLVAMRGLKLTFEGYLDAMFSTRHRDNLANGCPMTASASEIARQGPAVATSFAQAFEETVAVLEESIEGDLSASQKRHLAISALAAQIGAIAVARAVANVDPLLSKEVLRAVRETVTSAPPAKEKKAGRSSHPHPTRSKRTSS
jgi:TetR/AcrR family transcriptional regulator, transcriptional repressor for nem operon